MPSSIASSATSAPTEPATARSLLRAWAVMGVISFGGGQSIQLYAYRHFVQRRRHFRPAQWSEMWGICQLVPGMNLIALCVLVGARLAGAGGAVASLAGLLTPSIAITIAVTYLYARLAAIPAVGGAMRGVVAASVGMAMVNAIRIAGPPLAATRRLGRLAGAAGLVVPAVAGLLVFVTSLPIYALLVGGGIFVAAITWMASSQGAEG